MEKKNVWECYDEKQLEELGIDIRPETKEVTESINNR